MASQKVTSNQVDMVMKLVDRQKALKLLWGERYWEKMEPVIKLVKEIMAREGTKALPTRHPQGTIPPSMLRGESAGKERRSSRVVLVFKNARTIPSGEDKEDVTDGNGVVQTGATRQRAHEEVPGKDGPHERRIRRRRLKKEGR